MKTILADFAKEQVKKIKESRSFEIPKFSAGDTVSVKYKITEGSGESRMSSSLIVGTMKRGVMREYGV